jgi:hypothetical protein
VNEKFGKGALMYGDASRPDEQDRLPKGAEGEGVLTGTR